MEILKERVWNNVNAQSALFEGLYRSRDDGRRIRLRIRRNTYDFQSSATAQMWTDERGWVDVTSIPYPQMETLQQNNGYGKAKREHFEADMRTLIADVKAVLGLPVTT